MCLRLPRLRSGNGTGDHRGSCALALGAAMVVLASCATPEAPAPEPRPAPPRPAAARPPAGPSAAVPPPAPAIAVLEARRFEQDKDRIKLALASDPRNALAPADVGYYMDVLQGRLKQVAAKPVDIGRRGERIVLRWALQPGFEPDSSQITPPIRNSLASLTEVLAQYRMTLVSVLVGPEEPGSEASGAQLAQERSLAVARHLVDAGLASSRLVVRGYGTSAAPARNPKSTGVANIELQLDPIVREK